MNYVDWKDAKEFIAKCKARVKEMSPERLAAIDIIQQIKSAELGIEQLQKDLSRLRKAAMNLPKPKKEDLSIMPEIIKEGRYKFRGKRELEDELYGWFQKK